MGAIGGLVGLSGGANGTGFAAPGQANIQNGVDTTQVGNAYGQNQQALQQQQGLLNALQGQGGIQNQSNVFNQLGGVGSQLQNIASGQGPNPAQAMLNQQTGANVANQAALMAGQRGAGSNVGLMARQAAQQGAATQQQAVGQGATMQANQSLGALGQLQGVLGQQGQLANTMAANQIGATGAVTSAQQAEQANLLNAMGGQNTASVGSQGSVNAGNTALANTTMQGQQGLIGGMLNTLGGGAAGGKAHGGQVTGYDDGGDVAPAMTPTAPGSETGLGSLGPSSQGPQSSFGQFLSGGVKGGGDTPQSASETTPDSGASALFQGASALGNNIKEAMSGGPMMSGGGGGGGGMSSMLPMLAMAASKGGMVDVVLSPGEKVVDPDKVGAAAGGKVQAKTVPGKAKVKGDNEKNDTYKTKLREGTIIVPRTKSKDNKDSAAFVRKTLAKRRGK